MDATSLAPLVVPYLVQYAPQLVEAAKTAGEKALEKIGETAAEDGWKFGKELLAKLWPRIAAKPAALEAAQKVAQSPDNAKYQTALEVQVEDILAADRDLLESVRKIIESAQGAGVAINVAGNRNVAIGRDNSGVIVTGDSNTISR